MMPVYSAFRMVIAVTLTMMVAIAASAQTPPNKGVRLKHITSPAAFTATVGSIGDYEMMEKTTFYDKGRYPATPHIFYYKLSFKKDVSDNLTLYRGITADAGMGKEKRNEVFENDPALEEVMDGRLGTGEFSNVFAARLRSNSKEEWIYYLYVSLRHINQDNQVVSIRGSYAAHVNGAEAAAPEPMSSSEAISLLLKMLEPIAK